MSGFFHADKTGRFSDVRFNLNSTSTYQALALPAAGHPVSSKEPYEFGFLYSRLSESFVARIAADLKRKKKTAEAVEFLALAKSLTGFMRYDPKTKTFTAVHVDRWKRFSDLARLAGHPLGLSFWKGMVWEERLHAFFDVFGWELRPGGRLTNVVYNFVLTDLGQRFAKEYRIRAPTSYGDQGLLEFTQELHAKFWLSRIASELNPTAFGFHIFQEFNADLIRALDRTLLLSGTGQDKFMQGFLSLLTPVERKAAPYGHNFNPANPTTRQELKKLIIRALGPRRHALRSGTLALSKAAYRKRLATPTYGSFMQILIPSGVNLPTFKEIDLKIAKQELIAEQGKTLLIQAQQDWPELMEADTAVEDFTMRRNSLLRDARWAAANGYSQIAYLDLPEYLSYRLGQYGYQDVARLIADVLLQLHEDRSSTVPQIFMRVIFVDSDFFTYADRFSTRQLNASIPTLEPGLQGGDIVQIRSPFNYHKRAVLLETPLKSDVRVKLLPVHYWGDNALGFLESKRFLEHGYATAIREYTVAQLAWPGLKIVKEPIQTDDYAIKIGEKFNLVHEGRSRACTVIGIAHAHYILVMDEPIGKDMGGFALYIPRLSAMKLLEAGQLKRIQSWNLKLPRMPFGPQSRCIWALPLLPSFFLGETSSLSSALGGLTGLAMTAYGAWKDPAFFGKSNHLTNSPLLLHCS